MNNIQTKKIATSAALIALMAATRMHHFGSSLHLPDASLAVFLLAGFLIASPVFFAALLIEAGLLDYVAIAHMGVSDYCVSPAYWFLIPTYAVLWYAGRYCVQGHRESLGLFSVASFAAVSVAFFISNFSFYLFSGNYGDMGIGAYALRVAPYYLPYVASAAVYLAPAVVLHALFALKGNDAKHA
jgi:hypothetical protein